MNLCFSLGNLQLSVILEIAVGLGLALITLHVGAPRSITGGSVRLPVRPLGLGTRGTNYPIGAACVVDLERELPVQYAVEIHEHIVVKFAV